MARLVRLTFLNYLILGFGQVFGVEDQPASEIAIKNKISFFAASNDFDAKDRFVIPMPALPPEGTDIFLIDFDGNFVPLKATETKPAYAPPKGQMPFYGFASIGPKPPVLGDQSSYLVVTGKDVKTFVKWKTKKFAQGRLSPEECMKPESGFITRQLQVDSIEDRSYQFYFSEATAFESSKPKSNSKEAKNFLYLHYKLGVAEKGKCKVLASAEFDTNGYIQKGQLPLGPVIGILELSDKDKVKGKVEKWLVLNSHAFEAWGITLVEALSPSTNAQPKTQYLYADNL